MRHIWKEVIPAQLATPFEPTTLEVERESDRNHRIELEGGHISVQLIFFRLDVCLKCGIGAHGLAEQSAGVASTSSDVECSTRRTGVNESSLERDAEMPVVAREEVSPADGKHGASLHEVNLASTRDWVGWIAGVSGVVESKGIAARNGSVGCDLVAVVDEHAGAEMEAAAEREPVIVSFCGEKAQLRGVGDPVLVEAAVIAEYVEPSTQVGTESNRRRHFHARAQRGCFDGDAKPREWLAEAAFLLRGTAAGMDEGGENREYKHG